jgi:methyl-accepting chemotaxis protein
MADTDDSGEAAERLAAALERIADSAEHRMMTARQATENATEVGARLDRLIAELREALEGTAS